MTAADSTGFAERYATDARVLDGNALGERAAPRTRSRSAAQPMARRAVRELHMKGAVS